MTTSPATLRSRCELPRSAHRPGAPLLLPNAWDVATAKAVAEARVPRSRDHQSGRRRHVRIPGRRARVGRRDARSGRANRAERRGARHRRREAGYGMDPHDLVSSLPSAGAASCNFEATDHVPGTLRTPAATGNGSGRFAGLRRTTASRSSSTRAWTSASPPFPPAPVAGPRTTSCPKRYGTRTPYSEAGAGCVYPIGLWEAAAPRRLVSDVQGPVKRRPQPTDRSRRPAGRAGRRPSQLRAVPARDAMTRLKERLASLRS